MPIAARDEYLATEVLTAAPQKLHLMLIEGAIRFAKRAELQRRQQEHEAAFKSIVRAQEVVSQLIAGFASNLDQLFVRQTAAVYSFIYRSLVLANVNRDDAKLTDALRLLEIERETWRQVCEQLGTKRAADATDSPPATEIPATRIAPLLNTIVSFDDSATGFSFEA
jgi:flagellar protein FliS